MAHRMEYDDFVIQILHGQDDSYGVLVESPAVPGNGRFEIPAGLGSAVRARSALATRDLGSILDRTSTRSLSVREIGDLLFQALFKDEIRDLFHESIGQIRGSDRGLRIRLRIDSDLGGVQALPWELLHREKTDDFLGADRRFSVVRSLDVMRPLVPAPGANRLRILAVALSPRGYDDLDLAAERGILERAAKRWLSADIDFR
ncbi:MAG TPA: hypothetical protein VLX28_11100, partial [Thermoanaerobaculia bacterium]|nr:hypothetical protein [Thermoanaerobaculia bacterium]